MEEKANKIIKMESSTSTKLYGLHEENFRFLPEAIIHEIMKYLPMKNVARTSVLSKQWNTHWYTFPIIHLVEKDIIEEDVVIRREKFKRCLQLLLLHHSLSNLKTLYIDVNSPIDDELCHLLDRVIVAAIERKATYISLLFDITRNSAICYPLPEVMFISGAFLQNIILDGCRFEVGENFVNLPSLKEISLRNCDISETFLYTLIHGCPKIESLELICCTGIKLVKITSSTIKSLLEFLCDDVKEYNLNTPDLVSLNYTGHLVYFAQLVVSDEFGARVHLSGMDGDIFVNPLEFVKVFSGARVLTMIFFDKGVKNVYLHATSGMDNKSDKVGSFNALTSLVKILSTILCSSLRHQTLEIYFPFSSIELQFQEVNTDNVKAANMKCIKHRLVKATIGNFKCANEDINLLEFLCGKAAHLRQIVISTPHMHRFSDIAYWLECLSKASPTVQIELSPS